MHYTYDAEADALYISLVNDAQVKETTRIDDRRNVDLDSNGSVIGVEVLSPGRGFPVDDLIDRFQLTEFRAFLQSVASTLFQPMPQMGSR